MSRLVRMATVQYQAKQIIKLTDLSKTTTELLEKNSYAYSCSFMKTEEDR